MNGENLASSVTGWTIINKGSAPLDSAYVSLWADIDFDDPQENVPAIDTVHQLAYCWFGTDSWKNMGSAVGYVLLHGPGVPGGSAPADFRGRKLAGMRNLPIGSFWGIGNDSTPDTSSIGPAYGIGSTWNIARGLNKHGMPIIDPVTGAVTKFPYSGNPATGKGWIFPTTFLGGGSGFNFFCGPFTMAVGDTQWVLAVLVPAYGKNRFDSIEWLRHFAYVLRSMPYDSITGGRIDQIPCERSDSTASVTETSLLPIHPNPSGAGVTIDFKLADESHVLIRIYNVLGRLVARLIDEQKAPGSYSARFEPSGCASGLYFARLTTTQGSLTGKFLLVK